MRKCHSRFVHVRVDDSVVSAEHLSAQKNKMPEYVSFSHRQFYICLRNNEVEGISCFQLRWLWCQNNWHYGYDTIWQVLCHVYSAVSWTSKWPCQISLEPLIMSLFFNFTASGSSILFSIKGIILRLLTGSWQFLNDVSHLAPVHSLKGWLVARCCFTCQAKHRGSLASLHAWHTLPPTVVMKLLDCSPIGEMELLQM